MFRKIKQWLQKHTQPQIIDGGPKRKGAIQIPPFIDPYITSDINITRNKHQFPLTHNNRDEQ